MFSVRCRTSKISARVTRNLPVRQLQTCTVVQSCPDILCSHCRNIVAFKGMGRQEESEYLMQEYIVGGAATVLHAAHAHMYPQR